MNGFAILLNFTERIAVVKANLRILIFINKYSQTYRFKKITIISNSRDPRLTKIMSNNKYVIVNKFIDMLIKLLFTILKPMLEYFKRVKG